MKFAFDDIVVHRKGGRYRITGLPDRYRLESTGEPAYAYVAADGRDLTIWVRAQSEMEDGRFRPQGSEWTHAAES